MLHFSRRSTGVLAALLMLFAAEQGWAQVRSQTTASGGAGLSVIDLQGHRGARGLLPENTVPSVLAALDHGVETIELDVVVSGDGEVVVSHEPWMSSVICRDPNGAPIREDREREYNLFELSYADIAAFDCGSRGHPSFPDQRPTAASKPLLRDVLRIADGYAMVSGRPLPRYNVEIKSAPDNDGIYHPSPDAFSRLVYDVLADEAVRDRSTIQSFDVRSVRSVRSIDATQTVALLVNNDEGFEANLRQLGFLPNIYSPNERLVDAALIEAAHAVDMAVVPWTVNASEDMRRLLDLGVDGLITDYPDRGRAVVDAYLRGRQDN